MPCVTKVNVFDKIPVRECELINVSDLLSDDVREKMKNRYLSNPDYNFEKVNRASMACGPMVKWAIAQVKAIRITFDWVAKN